MAIECNPRATSGIHLFGGGTALVGVMTEEAERKKRERMDGQQTGAPNLNGPTSATSRRTLSNPSSPMSVMEAPSTALRDPLPSDDSVRQTGNGDHQPIRVPARTTKRKVAPGMLMWKRSSSASNPRDLLAEYAVHMKRLVLTKDVLWDWKARLSLVD